jgi:hypothetical protein
MLAGQSPKMKWKENPGRKKRTIEEAKEIARRNGVSIPDDVEFFEDEGNVLPDNVTARGPEVTKPSGSTVLWSDLLNGLTDQVPFLLNSSILTSDEAIVAVLGHEMFELEALRDFLIEGQTFIESFIGHTSPNNPGNLHDQAWDYSDKLVKKMRRRKKK